MERADLRRRVAASALLALAFVANGCVVDNPVLETADPQDEPTVAAEPTATVAAPLFEPTAEPSPTVEATATPVPEPTATSAPAGPTPLPTSDPAGDFEPTAVEPGLVAIPVRNASFMLAQSRPILQLGGHTLIYVDGDRTAEVDIFVPAAGADATPLNSFSVVIAYIQSTAAFADLAELSPVSIAGFPTRVFEGTAASTDRAFVTELGAEGNEVLGWFPPARMRLWVIDHPDGPVIVSAESLENPGRYSDAVRLATEVLSTIDFG